MNKAFIKVLQAILPVMSILPCYSQSFEGTIKLHVISGEIDNISKLTVKEDKTILELVVDSTEQIKIVKDWGSESTTLLRNKYGLKYGFRSNGIADSAHPEEDEKNISEVITDVTDSVKWIGAQKCTKIMFKSPYAISEAWVTRDHEFRLSKYFPEFLGSNANEELFNLRKEAENHGLIIRYWEKLLDSDLESNIEVTVEKKEIQNEAFRIGPEYLVLDKDGMMQLYTDAQRDEVKKKQWEEFMLLFGHKE